MPRTVTPLVVYLRYLLKYLYISNGLGLLLLGLLYISIAFHNRSIRPNISV